MLTKNKNITSVLLMMLIIMGCEVFKDNTTYFEPDPVRMPETYASPSVSPDGETIVFTRRKVTDVYADGGYQVNSDSTGLWMIKTDGSRFQMLLQGMNISTSAISPDGKWIAFGAGAQIFKIPFDGEDVDISRMEQLTYEGRNFFPAWSPDGKKIAYRRSYSYPESGSIQGIWIMKSNGTDFKQIFSGNSGEPQWLSNDILYFFRGEINESGQSIGSALYTYDQSLDSIEIIFNTDHRMGYPRISPNMKTMMIVSNSYNKYQTIWYLDLEEYDIYPVIAEHPASHPNWVTNDRIVFVQSAVTQLSKNNGTLWIMTLGGSEKRQLTFNHGMVIHE